MSLIAMRPPSLKAADYQRALGLRPVARTAHFTLHTLPVAPPAPRRRVAGDDLSTSALLDDTVLVDDQPIAVSFSAPAGGPGWRFGLVLPKRLARRSVTRSLIRHQAREALRRHAPAVQASNRFGIEVAGWVLRLKAPYDRAQFPSAASTALHAVVRAELDELWTHVLRASAHPPQQRKGPG